jgi:hypothetical protein
LQINQPIERNLTVPHRSYLTRTLTVKAKSNVSLSLGRY